MTEQENLKPLLPIEQRIFTLRGQQVMLDSDLAELYEVETKRLNEQVRRNISRFPENFRFQLTQTEKEELVANCDRLNRLKHSSTCPYVFSEYGVAMLSADNKSEMITTVAIINDSIITSRSQIADID